MLRSVRGWSLGCEARIARMLGRSPSVIRGGIKRNAGADGCCRGGEAGHMAARRRARPKKRGQRRARPVHRPGQHPGAVHRRRARVVLRRARRRTVAA